MASIVTFDLSSMSKPGLWQTLREMYKAVRYFGNEELDVLKREVLDLQAQVDKLKELRAKRVQYEEEMTLAQVRASVGRLMGQQAADEHRQTAMMQAMDQKEEELLGKLQSEMQGKMQQRMAAVMGDLDLDRLLHDPSIDIRRAVKDSIANHAQARVREKWEGRPTQNPPDGCEAKGHKCGQAPMSSRLEVMLAGTRPLFYTIDLAGGQK
ncbi:hypothetical protein WJX84_009269 [Apatococcus fuscideae]|uniref:Uncharacterized protein n=1 Tax=Apatococcus fuscideae TaxID=2026836 RepID=A0AAW1S1S5_9CHLO